MRAQPTPEQLHDALHACRISMSLETAMQSRALALALTNTALALANRRTQRQTIDHKRRAAGDTD